MVLGKSVRELGDLLTFSLTSQGNTHKSSESNTLSGLAFCFQTMALLILPVLPASLERR
jgi:hypothetical protein